MNQSAHSSSMALKIQWPIVYTAISLGLILSWLVLSGDQQGRVNIFYLLLVYLFIPVLSVIASLISLIKGKGINFARFISSLSFWPNDFKVLLRKNQQLHVDKYWFMMQSQAAAIGFSFASLLTFFILLLVTDINFVWRSTILEPSHVLPLLEWIAKPWQFWPSAQPSLSLLDITQDSRLATTDTVTAAYGVWWKFILATQICYSFLLRIFLFLSSRLWLNKIISSDIEEQLQHSFVQKTHQKQQQYINDIQHIIPEPVQILNWDNLSNDTLNLLKVNHENLFSSDVINRTEFEESELKSSEFLGRKSELLVIVKAWEAPLGELDDALKNTRGYLFPLDYSESSINKLASQHLQEWQRFISKLPDCSLYIPEELMPDE